MLNKIARYNLIGLQPLNQPDLKDSVVLDQRLEVATSVVADTMKMVRTAANREAELQTDGDNTEFDLEAEVNSHPDSLFVKCFAIKADETNDIGDYFG